MLPSKDKCLLHVRYIKNEMCLDIRLLFYFQIFTLQILYTFPGLFTFPKRAFQVSNLRTNPFYRKHTNTKSHPPSGFATFAERHSMKKGG